MYPLPLPTLRKTPSRQENPTPQPIIKPKGVPPWFAWRILGEWYQTPEELNKFVRRFLMDPKTPVPPELIINLPTAFNVPTDVLQYTSPNSCKVHRLIPGKILEHLDRGFNMYLESFKSVPRGQYRRQLTRLATGKLPVKERVKLFELHRYRAEIEQGGKYSELYRKRNQCVGCRVTCCMREEDILRLLVFAKEICQTDLNPFFEEAWKCRQEMVKEGIVTPRGLAIKFLAGIVGREYRALFDILEYFRM
ncbi:hypothetical protein FPQ18DRAFT_414454 [Pyronema domesticum]|nr:hypothetical protein FPQ18DRAFT_414454 [Pyronema domesticum]